MYAHNNIIILHSIEVTNQLIWNRLQKNDIYDTAEFQANESNPVFSKNIRRQKHPLNICD